MPSGPTQKMGSAHTRRTAPHAFRPQPRTKGVGYPGSLRCGKPLAETLLLASIAILAATPIAAQGAGAPAPVAGTPASAATHVKKSSSHTNLAATQPAPQPASAVSATPAAPPAPDWPANDHPSEASVTWDAHGLRVVAANSSLIQIMKEVSTQTGATLEGLGKDQRIFGIYGPGPARDVITQLLDGSGYNLLMIGDSGQGTPRQIILTPQAGGGAQSPASNNQNQANEEDSEAEQQAQQPEPLPQQPPMPPGGAAPAVPVRSQQQILEQLQERRQEIQQQQQQQQNP
jgi:hypothetical protein